MKLNVISHYAASLGLSGLLLILCNTSSVRYETAVSHHVLPAYAPAGSVQECQESYSLQHIRNYPVFFLGDSRTVGMEQALSAGGYDLTCHTFLAKVGKGYSWLVTQSRTLEDFEHSPQIIIINLGVNDLGNCGKYQQLYDTYLDSCWQNCPVYIVSVNPVCSPCHSVSNAQIERFNESMQDWINEENASAPAEAFPIRYIDTYSYLQETGFSSSDGLHYSAATYLRIYDYILEQIKEPIGDGSGYIEAS